MAASTKQPYPIEDFSGGITDNAFSGDMHSCAVAQNFCISPARKLYSRPGSVVDDAINSPLPIGNSRIGRLVNYARNDALFAQSARNIYYRNGGPWSSVLGPSGNLPLSAGTTGNYISTAEWNRQLFVVGDAFQSPVKIYKDQNGAYQVRNIGMPALANAPTVTPTQTGSESYTYAFVYTYNYQVNAQSFIEIGPVTWVPITNSSDPSSSANTISNIPVLSNGASDNYDTSNVHVQIYRSLDNGQNFYLVGEVVNGATTFTDNMSDDTLQTKQGLYTNDGTLDYIQAPPSKFVHVVGNIGFYGFTKESDGLHAYRVKYSVVGNPGFVPFTQFFDLEDEVRGLHSVKSLSLAFCKKIVYRIDGASSPVSAQTVKIHNSAGCISNESLVEAENYCFWAGNDGFYATDGYQVIKISDHLNSTYQKMLNSSKDVLRIQGKFDEINRRVYWAVQTNASTLENDTLFVLDLRYGISPTSTFTTWTGNSFKPSAIEVFNGRLYRGDNNGFVYYHDTSLVSDPRVDVSKPVQAWSQEAIRWRYVSNQINFGSSFFRKFISRILLQAENAGNTSIQITAINDQGKKVRPLKPIRWRRNFTWGDEAFTWGSPDCVWDAEGLIEQWRRFPAVGLRISYLQIAIENAYGVVTASDGDGLLTLNKVAGTAILPNLWPSMSVDYDLYLSNDNYKRPYRITAINGSRDTITLSDPSNSLPPSGIYEWEIEGYEKNEALNLIGYTLHWDNVDQNQSTFRTGDSGAN